MRARRSWRNRECRPRAARRNCDFHIAEKVDRLAVVNDALATGNHPRNREKAGKGRNIWGDMSRPDKPPGRKSLICFIFANCVDGGAESVISLE